MSSGLRFLTHDFGVILRRAVRHRTL